MRLLSYRLLGNVLRSLSDSCFRAAEQQENGEAVTACGMSSDDLDEVYQQVQWMLDGKMNKYEASRKLNCSISTFDRLVAAGTLPEGQSRAGSHEKLWEKSVIMAFKNRNKRL